MSRKPTLSSIFLFCVVLSALFMTSCNKDKNQISIEGTVTDPNSGVKVEGVTVVFSSSKITNGVFNSGYTEIGRTTTDASGKFYFEQEEERTSGYRISMSKPGYFTVSKDISGTDIIAGTLFAPTYEIFPVAYIKLHVRNYTPIDENDIISYTFTSGYLGCYECCDNSLRFGYGTNIDEWLKCKTYGNQNVTIGWTVTKIASSMFYNATVYAIAHDTITYEINY
jgi:hypothetical protein